MRAHIQKWGNSLALRIPELFAEEAHLTEDAAVDVSIRNGMLVIAPVLEAEPSLDDLVRRITPANRHSETDTGVRSGDEIW
jgi:antitoxin MazE